jgi:site-specific recombinase XerD
VIEEFKKYLLYKERKSSSTIDTYSRCIQEFINWYYSSKNKEFLQLDRETIDSYKNYLIFVKKKKTQTVSVGLCALSMFNRFFCHKNAPKNYILSKEYKKIKGDV